MTSTHDMQPGPAVEGSSEQCLPSVPLSKCGVQYEGQFIPTGLVIEGSIEPDETTKRQELSDCSLSKEKAEQLANALLMQPRNQFYDEHYRPENPALCRIVKDAREFEAMLARRGYTLTIEDGHSVVIGGTIRITVAEEFFMYQTVAAVARQIDYLVGQHHMQCAQCHESLLLAREQITVSLARDDGMGMPYLTGETRLGDKPVFRSTKAGPQSLPLAVCPGCQVTLSEQTVEEIADV